MTPLYSCPQWIVVKLVPLPDGRTDKIPVDFSSGVVGVDAHAPKHWTNYAAARLIAEAWGPSYTVGFVLTAGDPFWCLDIDGALQADGQWSPLSVELCGSLPGTCVEISQSGRGLHVWGQGPVPAHSSKNVPLHIELYTERRFIAIGLRHNDGDMSRPCPEIAAVAARYFPPRSASGVELPDDGPRADWNGPADDDDLIRRALASRSNAGKFGGKATFADLWHAEHNILAKHYPADSNSSEPFDRSSADRALAQHLAFWTGCDQTRIDRLMRQSKLVRDKYDREDYMARTIGGACAQQVEVLADKKLERAGIPGDPPGDAAAAPAAGSRGPRMTAVQGQTFVSPTQATDLFEGCVYVVDQHRALVPGGHLVKPDQFRAMFGGYTFALDAANERTSRNAWEAFTESQVLRAPRADGTCFKPQLPYATMVHDAGRVRVNTYWPVNVPRQVGDPSRFLNHLAKLLPNKRDAQIMLYYMAAVVQHQGIKFQWATVLQGVEGNGKTMLSRCVAEAIGKRYVHWPKASKLAKQFNGWMVGKTLYCVEDIHTSEHVDVVEELKPMITGGDGLEIEAKGIDQISAEICGNFMFNTNHRNGLRKTVNDRRFAVFYCAQQNVADLARDGIDGDYMPKLYEWLNAGGYAIVAEYLWTLPIPDEFNPAKGCQRAPITSSTAEAIANSLGRVEQEITEAIEQGRPGFAGGWVSSMAVERLLSDMHLTRAVPLSARRGIMVTLGYDYHPALGPNGRVNNTIAIDAGKPKLYIKAGHPALALTTVADVARAYAEAQGVH